MSVEIKRVMTDDLTVYHDDDYVLAILKGGPMDGDQVRLSVQSALTMRAGRAELPPDLFFPGHTEGSGYRAWTIIEGKAYYYWYETPEERAKLL